MSDTNAHTKTSNDLHIEVICENPSPETIAEFKEDSVIIYVGSHGRRATFIPNIMSMMKTTKNEK